MTAGDVAALLLVAEQLPWAPTDWSLVPAWRAWRAEVASGRRRADLDGGLLEAAYWEAEACLSAAYGNPAHAEWCLRRADEAITEALEVAA